jgi:hypothetical protein
MLKFAFIRFTELASVKELEKTETYYLPTHTYIWDFTLLNQRYI